MWSSSVLSYKTKVFLEREEAIGITVLLWKRILHVVPGVVEVIQRVLLSYSHVDKLSHVQTNNREP